MAIRIRKVSGKTIALCAAETTSKPGDLYLDDTIHHALSTKFGLDWHSEGLIDDPLSDDKLVNLMKKENELYEELKKCDEFTKNGILYFLRVNR